ncbi:TonB-dependent receptor [Ottowia thiooxydans]|uniref:TonB-dependent receptor n=1 Tax=Ottowia thiooxydans TaxID=219182 RepID=UPI00146EFA46|nr:TonB-dependent receptor [Ottowia thiooxydans]
MRARWLGLSSASVLVAAASLMSPAASFAAEEKSATSAQLRRYEVPAGPLAVRVNDLARAAGVVLSFDPVLADGKQGRAVRGSHTVAEAFSMLLEGSGLEAIATAAGRYTLRRAPSAATSARAAQGSATLPVVTVTASASTAPDIPLPSYAGGQVARGGRAGMLGNRDMFDTPHATVSLTSELLQNQQVRNVSEAIRNDGSVRLGRTGQSSSFDSVYYIRGFFGSTGDMAFDGLFGLNSRGIATDQMEYVEILKGPSAFLNGRVGNSVGGTINLVPKRAGEEPLNSVSFRHVSKSISGVHADIGRRFGGQGAWGLRINASHDEGGSAVVPARNRQSNLSAALDYRSERLTASLDLDHGKTRIHGFSSGITFASGIQIPSAPRADRLIAQPWNFNNLTSDRAVLRAQYELADGWFLGGAYGQNKVDNPNLECRTNLTSSAGGYTQSCNVAGSSGKASTGEINLRGRIRTGEVEHLMSFSMTDADNSVGTANPVTFANYAGSIYAPVLASQPVTPAMPVVGKTSASTFSSAGLGYELVALKGDLRVLLGLRGVKIDARNLDRNTGAITTSYGASGTTPSVGLVYKPVENVSVYGNYAQALEQGATAPSTAINANEVLGPLRSKQVEIGAKVDFGKFAVTAAVFEIRKGLQYLEANRYVQDGRQTHRGLELGVFGEPTRGVRVLSSLQLLNPKADRTANGQYDGLRPVGVPKLQAKAYVEWDQSYLPGLTFTGGVEHLSGQYANAANTQSIPGWTRFDLGVRYTTRWAQVPVTLRLNVENVADKNYWAAIDRTQMYLGSPRLISFSLNAKF